MIFNSGLAVDAGLFDIWQQELAERHQIRYSELNPADMVINQPEEAELLVRAWFYNGRSRDLYIALFHNLHKMAIIKWLVQSPAAMIQELSPIPARVYSDLSPPPGSAAVFNPSVQR